MQYLTRWQSRAWWKWHGGRLCCTPWVNGVCVKFLYCLSFSHRHMETTIFCIFHSSPARSLKNKILLKHYKIREHQNHSKYLYVTCCPELTGLTSQSHLSFPCAGLFTKSVPQPTWEMSIFSMHCVALSPAYFENQNLALKWLISHPMVLSLPWSLKVYWDQTKSTFFDSFRLFALVYLPDNKKSKGILCLCYIWSSDVEFEIRTAGRSWKSEQRWKNLGFTLQYFIWLQHSCILIAFVISPAKIQPLVSQSG